MEVADTCPSGTRLRGGSVPSSCSRNAILDPLRLASRLASPPAYHEAHTVGRGRTGANGLRRGKRGAFSHLYMPSYGMVSEPDAAMPHLGIRTALVVVHDPRRPEGRSNGPCVALRRVPLACDAAGKGLVQQREGAHLYVRWSERWSLRRGEGEGLGSNGESREGVRGQGAGV